MMQFMLFLCVLSQLPKLPPARPFFSLNSTLQVNQRMEGLQRFMEAYVPTAMKRIFLISSHLPCNQYPI